MGPGSSNMWSPVLIQASAWTVVVCGPLLVFPLNFFIIYIFQKAVVITAVLPTPSPKCPIGLHADLTAEAPLHPVHGGRLSTVSSLRERNPLTTEGPGGEEVGVDRHRSGPHSSVHSACNVSLSPWVPSPVSTSARRDAGNEG